jgi:hypothetical protein
MYKVLFMITHLTMDTIGKFPCYISHKEYLQQDFFLHLVFSSNESFK